MPSITTYVHRDAVDEAEQFLKGATALVSSLERALRQGLEITAGSRIKRLRHLGTTSERRIRINKVRSVYSHVTHADGRSLVFVHSVSPRGEAYSRDAFRSRVDGFHSQVWDRVDRVFRIDLSDSVYSEIPYVEPADEHYDSIVLEPYLTDQQYEYSSFLLPLGEHPIHGDPFLILGHGPPGSGKTVVLQQAAVRAWEEQTSVLILVPSNRLVSEYQEALQPYGIEPARLSEIAQPGPRVILQDVRDFFSERGGIDRRPSERREAARQWWDRCCGDTGLRRRVGAQPEQWHRRFVDLLDALYSDDTFWERNQDGQRVRDDVDEFNRDVYTLLRELRSKPKWQDLLAAERGANLVLRCELGERAANSQGDLMPDDGPLLVLIDESQDLVPAEWRALLSLCAKRRRHSETRVTFVGDLNQRVSVTPFGWPALNRYACEVLAIQPGSAAARRLIIEQQVEAMSLRFAREIGIVAEAVLDRSVTRRGKNRVSAMADPEKLTANGEVQVVVVKQDVWADVFRSGKRLAAAEGPDSRLCIICGDDHASLRPEAEDAQVLVFTPRAVKGLEFDAAVIVHPIESSLGSDSDMLTYEQGVALYTSVTRARERLLCVLTEREWSCLGRAHESWERAGVTQITRPVGDPSVAFDGILPRFIQAMSQADLDDFIVGKLANLAAGPDGAEAQWIDDVICVSARMVRRGLLEEIVTYGSSIPLDWPSAVKALRIGAQRLSEPVTAVGCLLILGEIAAARQVVEDAVCGMADPICSSEALELLELDTAWQPFVYEERRRNGDTSSPSERIVGRFMTTALTARLGEVRAMIPSNIN